MDFHTFYSIFYLFIFIFHFTTVSFCFRFFSLPPTPTFTYVYMLYMLYNLFLDIWRTSKQLIPRSRGFLRELGRRVRSESGDANSTSHLLQRISIAVQRGMHASRPNSFYYYYYFIIILIILFLSLFLSFFLYFFLYLFIYLLYCISCYMYIYLFIYCTISYNFIILYCIVLL